MCCLLAWVRHLLVKRPADRYTAEEAVSRQIVDRAAPEEEVLPEAVRMAAELASKADPVMSVLKRGMYPETLEALRGEF